MDDSKVQPSVIHSWTQWLRASGLGAVVAAWLVPAHPAVLLGRNALYVAEPLFGEAVARLGRQLDDPQALQAWAMALGGEESEVPA